MEESEEELKSLLMTVKEESEKADSKLNIKKLRSWHSVPLLHDKQKRGKVEAVTDFIFLGSKSMRTVYYSHETKRLLLLGRKAIMNLDSIRKRRHYFANKGPSHQNYGFSNS